VPRVHPAKALIVASGESYADAARATGYSPGVLTRVLNGSARTWPKLRTAVADHLGLPESECWLDDGGTAARRLNERSGGAGPITDPSTLDRVAAILRNAEVHNGS
jgi:lambda repressor-like predicted transcriptional regulator